MANNWQLTTLTLCHRQDWLSQAHWPHFAQDHFTEELFSCGVSRRGWQLMAATFEWTVDSWYTAVCFYSVQLNTTFDTFPIFRTKINLLELMYATFRQLLLTALSAAQLLNWVCKDTTQQQKQQQSWVYSRLSRDYASTTLLMQLLRSIPWTQDCTMLSL